MSLQQYLQTIKGIDPGKIYVEHVRSAYNTTRLQARILCEMAVKENLFVKKIGLVCPAPTCHKRIIADFDSFDEIPEEITCDICEAEDNHPFTYKTSELEKIEFYQLRK